MALPGCLPVAGVLDEEEAAAILEPIYASLLERFCARGLEELRRTQLRIDGSVHDASRHFAATRGDGKLIILAPELAEMPNDIAHGIIAHELGHAADFWKPGRFGIDDEAALVIRADDADVDWARIVKAWDKRSDDTVELTADAIASWVIGQAIGYRGPCLLQTFAGGVPRPRGLR